MCPPVSVRCPALLSAAPTPTESLPIAHADNISVQLGGIISANIYRADDKVSPLLTPSPLLITPPMHTALLPPRQQDPPRHHRRQSRPLCPHQSLFRSPQPPQETSVGVALVRGEATLSTDDHGRGKSAIGLPVCSLSVGWEGFGDDQRIRGARLLESRESVAVHLKAKHWYHNCSTRAKRVRGRALASAIN